MPQAMTHEQARAILQEVHRRFGAGAAEDVRQSILGELFPEQRAYLDDDSPAKALFCTRRAGKTFVLAGDLVLTANAVPGNDCLAIYPTAKQGKKVLWDGPDGLKRVEKKHAVGMRFNNTDMVALLPNGSKIIVGGAENRDDIEQYLGQKYKKVALDEAQSFKPHIDDLMERVLQPTLLDLRGQMVLCGVPGTVLAGTYYDVTRTSGTRRGGWSVHSWSVLNNPHLPHAAEYIAYLKGLNGWTDETPQFAREWLGRWALDTNTLVYRFRSSMGLYLALPDKVEFDCVLGIDLGYNDDTAFRIVFFSSAVGQCFFGPRFKKKGMTPSQVAEKTNEFVQRYHPVRIVADTGGLGKQVIAEYNSRFKQAAHPAEKKNKLDFIEMMNDDFAAGRIKVLPDDPIIAEWAALQWQADTGDRKIEDPRFDNHEADAALYAWRESRHYMFVEPVKVPLPGQEGYWEHVETEQLEREMAAFEQRQYGEWWELTGDAA